MILINATYFLLAGLLFCLLAMKSSQMRRASLVVISLCMLSPYIFVGQWDSGGAALLVVFGMVFPAFTPSRVAVPDSWSKLALVFMILLSAAIYQLEGSNQVQASLLLCLAVAVLMMALAGSLGRLHEALELGFLALCVSVINRDAGLAHIILLVASKILLTLVTQASFLKQYTRHIDHFNDLKILRG